MHAEWIDAEDFADVVSGGTKGSTASFGLVGGPETGYSWSQQSTPSFGALNVAEKLPVAGRIVDLTRRVVWINEIQHWQVTSSGEGGAAAVGDYFSVEVAGVAGTALDGWVSCLALICRALFPTIQLGH